MHQECLSHILSKSLKVEQSDRSYKIVFVRGLRMNTIWLSPYGLWDNESLDIPYAFYEGEEDMVWGCWVQLYTYESVKGMWVGKYSIQMIRGCKNTCEMRKNLIWVDWSCEGIFKLNRASFEWFKGAKAYLSWEMHVLSGLRLERKIWDEKGLIWMIWGCKNIFKLRRG